MKTKNRTLTKELLAEALTSPPAVFENPAEIVGRKDLTRAQKIEILKRWELDARGLERASDESMTGGEPSRLDEINDALLKLDPQDEAIDAFGNTPTKI